MTAPSSLTFAELLRYHRAASGLTQEELAQRARLSVDAVSTLERGVRRWPRKDTVASLAQALALLPDDYIVFAAAARRAPTVALVATSQVDAAQSGKAPTPAPADLPHGVVAFFFADSESSTRLLHQNGDRYADALADLPDVLRAAWTAQPGHALSAQGDHFFAVFANVEDALAAAAAAQQAIEVLRSL